jgi:hypothetical protein
LSKFDRDSFVSTADDFAHPTIAMVLRFCVCYVASGNTKSAKLFFAMIEIVPGTVGREHHSWHSGAVCKSESEYNSLPRQCWFALGMVNPHPGLVPTSAGCVVHPGFISGKLSGILEYGGPRADLISPARKNNAIA